MSLSGLIGISLLAVLADRHVLDRIFGTASPVGTGTGSIHLVKAVSVICLLVPTACCSRLLGDFVLAPAGLAYLNPLAFMAFALLFSQGAEALLARKGNFALVNRLAQRTAVLCTLLGLTAVLPLSGNSCGSGTFTAGAALAGFAFGGVLLLFTGIREKTRPGFGESAQLSLARDITLAALLALALGGFSGLHRYGG